MMQGLKFLLLVATAVCAVCESEYYCGSIRIQEPFVNQNPLLQHMLLCKSQTLYFRTTLGLYEVSSIDYIQKLVVLSVSLTPCFPTSNYVSPNHLSAGFPPPPTPNSLVLLNCSGMSSNSCINNCFDAYVDNGLSSCLIINDVDNGFHSKLINCTHYGVVYRRDDGMLESGMKVSFEIGHVPNPCDQCRKPGGDCGSGLKCICSPMKCKDKVISIGVIWKNKPNGGLPFLLVLVVLVSGILG